MSGEDAIGEIRRIKRVADQSCSAHARLRDRLSWQATALDVLVLAASAWSLSLAFADQAIASRLTPFGLTATIWIGLLSTATFIATLVQLKLDLKGRSEAHKRAAEAQAELKRAATEAERQPDDDTLATIKAKQALASAAGIPIPEGEFLKQKSIHLRKVAVSRYLDDRPFASIFLLQCQWWWRDNFAAGPNLRAEAVADKSSGSP